MQKDNLYKNNDFLNRQKKLININYNKNHFINFPSNIKKLLYHKSKYKTENDDLNDYSLSLKKTISSLNSNNGYIKSNNIFNNQKILINKNEIENILQSKKIKKEKSNSVIEFNKSIEEYNKILFPEINSNSNSFIISSYITKNDKIEKEPSKNNLVLPTNNSYNNIKINKKIKSSFFNNNSSINKKCNYLVLKYNKKENKSKSNKKIIKLNINKIINSINALLIPKDKTFEILEYLINDRIKNKNSLHNLDDFCLINNNIKYSKIIENLFTDIIKKIYKLMLKKGYKFNSLISKNEIKEEYKNQINILKEDLNEAKNSKENQFFNYYKSNSSNRLINNKQYIKLIVKKYKKDINNNQLNEEKNINNQIINNKEQIINKNKSYDNIIFHFYDFDDATKEIKKQNLTKEKLNKNFNNHFLSSAPLDHDIIKKIKNSFIKKYIEYSQCRDKKCKNNDKEFNKILNYLESFDKTNRNKKTLKYILNNEDKIKNEQISILGLKKNVNINKIGNSSDCSISNDNNYKDKNKENKENNLNNNIMKKHFVNEIYNRNYMNNFFLTNKNEKKLQKIDKYDNLFFPSNKKLKKNEDIISFIKNENENEKIYKPNKKDTKRYLKFYKYSFNNIIIEENNKKRLSKNDSKIKSDKKNNNEDSDSSNLKINSSSYTSSEIDTISKTNNKNNINNINNTNKSNNKTNSLNNSIDEHIKIKNIHIKIKRYNTISYIKKNNLNIVIPKEPVITNDFSQIIDYQLKIYKSKYSDRIDKKHITICQKLSELFFNENENKNRKRNNDKNKKNENSFLKRAIFHKRKTKKEVTFKEFLKNGIENIDDEKVEPKKEEKKQNNWELKFNMFKNYVHKLKEMNNDEFIKDTMKFINEEDES